MHKSILGMGDQHLVRDAAELTAKHEAHIAAMQRHGSTVQAHDADSTLGAYINHGRWVADCLCGAGIALDPEWDVALCFGCGARYADISWPEHMEKAVPALLLRPRTENRNWRPETEDVLALETENTEHGIGRVD